MEWLREGATLEDSSGPLSIGYIDSKGRSFNHFHDPLKPWDQAGLNDLVTGMSSVFWAQYGAYQDNFYEGNWSWSKTREYYYTALTGKTSGSVLIAEDLPKKKEYLARTFKGLGHQMHLIQDTAVPEHVRNDTHAEDALFGSSRKTGSMYFESWAKNYRWIINSLAAKPIFPNLPLNVSNNGLAPIIQLSDTDQYDGFNASAGINQGLAEYTNANFFSNDTIFAAERYSTSNVHYFPYPMKSSTDLQQYIDQNKLPEMVIGEDNIPDTSFYIKKERDGESIARFVRTGYFTALIDPDTDLTLYSRTFYRDENCHKDYVEHLVPRAVGYSTALLDYFFRGTIEIATPASGTYGFAEATLVPNPSYDGFSRISLRAKNITPNGDEMNDGTIELVIKYKLASRDPFQSTTVPAFDFRYKVVPVSNGIRAIPRGEFVTLTFDLSSDPLPVYAVDVYMQLVYRGKLGYEEGAVAVGFKDISEPTPIDIYNNMDKICLNGQWIEAGSPEAIAEVDSNNNGTAYGPDEWDVYPHNLQNIYIAFYNEADGIRYASPAGYDIVVTSIPVQGFKRSVFVLGDEQIHFSFDAVRARVSGQDFWTHPDDISLYHGTTVKNQEGDFPVMYSFRGIKMWSGAGFIYINPPYPADSVCPLNLL